MGENNQIKTKSALLIYGSHRIKKSASFHLGEYFAKGLKKGGFKVEEIMLTDFEIKHYIGCYSCWNKSPGRCIQRDDMDFLFPKIICADLIIYATPLYIFSVPGIVKDFLVRQIPETKPYLIDKKGVTSHPTRRKKKRGLFLICVAGFPE